MHVVQLYLCEKCGNMTQIAQRLKQSFDRYFEAPLAAWQEFARHSEVVKFGKNEIIKPYGKAENHGYFILKGSGGVFIWKDSHYVCLDLMYEDAFFADYMSLITQAQSPLETMALEDSEMLRISRDQIDMLKQTPVGMAIFLISAEWSYVEKQQQQIDLLLKTAEERYTEILEKQPNLVQRTPQKHLASYLGITTQSLSRIRRKLATIR